MNALPPGPRPTRARLGMLGLLLVATTINYVDRSNLSIVAPFLSKELDLDPVQMGLLFSAFAWSYAVANLPGGYLIDRFGSRLVYGVAQIAWSAATLGLGLVSGFAALFGLRFAVGLAEAPAFPVNNRVLAIGFLVHGARGHSERDRLVRPLSRAARQPPRQRRGAGAHHGRWRADDDGAAGGSHVAAGPPPVARAPGMGARPREVCGDVVVVLPAHLVPDLPGARARAHVAQGRRRDVAAVHRRGARRHARRILVRRTAPPRRR